MSVSPERATAQLIALQGAALGLARRAGGAKALPPLLILTDPVRTPDPLALAERLPKSSGLVYRHFGAADARQTAFALAKVARQRGLVLLIGADIGLALACGAAGVHLPERDVATAVRLRARWPTALITAAAHSRPALQRAAAAQVDAALVSAIFPSRSLSAGAPIGVLRTAALARGADVPVYALGGVDQRTARRLTGTGVAGIAAIGAAIPPSVLA